MSNVQIMTGNSAAAWGAKLCKVQVVSAYPITPSTSVTETIANWVERGELKAEYVRVESEHSVMTVCVSASTVGARVFTSTSSHGLLYMHEQLHWAAGSRLPIVMCCVNRGVGAPWSIFNDQQDSIAQRDTGWIQIYCRDNQEIIDTVIQAYRIAEEVYCPVMVCYDGFVLSHTMMPVEIPDAEQVCRVPPPLQAPHDPLPGRSPEHQPGHLPLAAAGCGGGPPGRLHGHALEAPARPGGVAGRDRQDLPRLRGALRPRPRRDALELPDGRRRGPHRRHGLHRHGGDDGGRPAPGAGASGPASSASASTGPSPGRRSARPSGTSRRSSSSKRTSATATKGRSRADIKAALYGTGIQTPVHNYIAGLGGRDVKAA